MQPPSRYAIATAEQSRAIDSETVQSFGIDAFILMEVAGITAAKQILRTVDVGNHGVFLCGKGNNSGDSLVVARYLAQHGIRCSVVFVGGNNDLSPDAKRNLDLLRKIRETNSETTINFNSSWEKFDQNTEADFIVDGMLGTGLDSDLRGDFPDAVKWANSSLAPVFAMDIPTGLHSDSGEIMGKAIRADRTFAFGVLKQGYYLGKGHACCGNITYCELPFPHSAKSKCSAYSIDADWMPDSHGEPARHKYETGVVYIIAGSEGLTGAAIMAAKSAWAAGAGAVMLVCPRGLLQTFEFNLPQIIKKPVGTKDDDHFKEKHLNDVNQIIGEKDGKVLVGPGMGRNETTVTFINKLLTSNGGDFVIDADALWALAKIENWQKPKDSNWILTPHPGEMSTLLGIKIGSDLERLQEVREMAQQKGIYLLSKGFPVMVCSPEGRAYISNYDTRVFSRAGFGDVLAGTIAASYALGNTPATSCLKAMVSGYQKVQLLKEKNPHHIIEPLDLT